MWGKDRKCLDNQEFVCRDPRKQKFGWQWATSAVWSHRQWPYLLGSFPIVHPTVTPQRCPLPLPPAHHWPIALSVFIDLGKSGGELEGHDTSGTTHSQRSAEQRAGWTSPGASPGFKGVVAATGEGSPVDMPHQPLDEGRAWGCPTLTPVPCATPTRLTLSSRGQPRGRGTGKRSERVRGKTVWGSMCSASASARGGGGERSSQGRGTVRRYPWPALCLCSESRLSAVVPTQSSHWAPLVHSSQNPGLCLPTVFSAPSPLLSGVHST